jgi:hypothetical protein
MRVNQLVGSLRKKREIADSRKPQRLFVRFALRPESLRKERVDNPGVNPESSKNRRQSFIDGAPPQETFDTPRRN